MIFKCHTIQYTVSMTDQLLVFWILNTLDMVRICNSCMQRLFNWKLKIIAYHAIACAKSSVWSSIVHAEVVVNARCEDTISARVCRKQHSESRIDAQIGLLRLPRPTGFMMLFWSSSGHSLPRHPGPIHGFKSASQKNFPGQDWSDIH